MREAAMEVMKKQTFLVVGKGGVNWLVEATLSGCHGKSPHLLTTLGIAELDLRRIYSSQSMELESYWISICRMTKAGDPWAM